MKKLNLLRTTLIVLAAFSSCKKEITTARLNGGSINVTNAIIGAPSLNMMSPNAVASASNIISTNNFAIMPVKSGENSLSFGLPPVATTATAAAIPATVYYTQNLTMENIGNYSLFLTGTSLSAIDNVLIKETYTRMYTDSVCGVRFINLAPGSNPISVNLKGSSNGSEVPSLAYKAYSDFVKYAAKSVNATYVFEFRDAATGNLIKSYTLKTPYFHNVTLVLRGIVGGANGIVLDNDY